jgi:hypothetical protein
LLPEGRIVEIGGEHEDWYDPDFSIHNDVIVHDGRGGFQIYSYPKELFPPTDFLTATFVDNYIYIIGSLGYDSERQYGSTPVYRLHLDDYHIEAIASTGENPGWIYDHRADLVSASVIRVSGGKIYTLHKNEQQHRPNQKVFSLDLEKMVWGIDANSSNDNPM